jgi:flagellar basal body-associated protein FliL
MQMMKDKKVLAGGAVLLVALFWFYVKPHYLAAKPPVVFTAAQIASAPKPTIILGQPADPKVAETWEGLKMNLMAASNDPHYVLAVIALEFADPKHTYVGLTAAPAIDAKNTAFAAALEPDMHKVLDATTGVFGAKSLDDLAAPTGREQLKTDLMTAINAQLHNQQVVGVYFETFITQ